MICAFNVVLGLMTCTVTVFDSTHWPLRCARDFTKYSNPEIARRKVPLPAPLLHDVGVLMELKLNVPSSSQGNAEFSSNSKFMRPYWNSLNSESDTSSGVQHKSALSEL